MQNDVFYLKEAFKKLQVLNEDSFDLTVDRGVVDELQSFVADDIEAPYKEEIIDIDADTTDDLQDSYVGKVILKCNCCSTKIYKDPEEVFIDDETETANIDEECPSCGNLLGWTVIGKIEPFDENEFEEKEDEEDDEDELSDDEIGEAIKEALTEKCDDLHESSNDRDVKVFETREEAEKFFNKLPEMVDPRIDPVTYKNGDGTECTVYEVWYWDDIDDILGEGIERTGKKEVLGVGEYPKFVNIGFRYLGDDDDKRVARFFNNEDGKMYVYLYKGRIGDINPYEAEPYAIYDEEDSAKWLDITTDDFKESLGEELNDEHLDVEDVNINPETSVEHDQKLEDPEEEPVLDEPATITENLNEDVENISLDTNDTHIEVSPEEDGKVVVVAEPIENKEEEVAVEDEMIAPLNDEEIADIEANVPVEDGEAKDEIDVEDNFDIDEFDEESFNELGESFLKRVYENVDSFKTSNVDLNENKLVVEGNIKFKSGKENKTKFVFEGFKNTKRGKVLTSGLNETFSNSKKAFFLKGNLENKHFTCESLIYNYNVKSINESNENEVVRVYGRAVVRK